MRIMQIIGSKKAGGAETFYVRLVSALREHVEVLPVVRDKSWLDKRLTELDIPHKTADFGGMFDMKTKGQLKRYAASFKPDVIQSWMNRSSKFMPTNTKAVLVGRMGGYYSLKYYRPMDYIIGNTQDICNYVVKKGWPAEKAVYLPNFADEPVSLYEDKHEELSQEIRQQFKIPDTAFVAMVAGRLHDNKGIDTAIEALTYIPDAHLIVVGDGPLEKNLKSQVVERNLVGRVHFSGWAAQISSFCAASDAWLVASRHEPLGNVILDAWMHKLPVVSTMTDGPKSLIDDEEDGLLVPTDNAKKMAAALTKLKDSPTLRVKLAENGYEKGVKEYGRDVVITDYLDFYEHITKKQ
jgi:glycosyltransferase involved in cell wall biosynthesis